MRVPFMPLATCLGPIDSVGHYLPGLATYLFILYSNYVGADLPAFVCAYLPTWHFLVAPGAEPQTYCCLPAFGTTFACRAFFYTALFGHFVLFHYSYGNLHTFSACRQTCNSLYLPVLCYTPVCWFYRPHRLGWMPCALTAVLPPQRTLFFIIRCLYSCVGWMGTCTYLLAPPTFCLFLYLCFFLLPGVCWNWAPILPCSAGSWRNRNSHCHMPSLPYIHYHTSATILFLHYLTSQVSFHAGLLLTCGGVIVGLLCLYAIFCPVCTSHMPSCACYYARQGACYKWLVLGCPGFGHRSKHVLYPPCRAKHGTGFFALVTCRACTAVTCWTYTLSTLPGLHGSSCGCAACYSVFTPCAYYGGPVYSFWWVCITCIYAGFLAFHLTNFFLLHVPWHAFFLLITMPYTTHYIQHFCIWYFRMGLLPSLSSGIPSPHILHTVP
jgi:hypothetical protein